MSATADALPPPRPQIVLRGRTIPVVLPKRSDPRLKLSATIFTLTVFGLTILRFQVSIPQILVCILVCMVIECAITLRRDGTLVWPASAIQTGLSVAFIFRIAGTRHGQLWSLNGIYVMAIVASLSLLSKYLIRRGGRHIFNPSNVGLAWGLLVLGPSHVFSEHLWWRPFGAAIVVSMAVIFGGAFWVLRQVKMIPMATVFLATFGALMALLSLSGDSYFARWHQGPVGGGFFWSTIAFSPEVLIFAFFMITDPQTAPKRPPARMLYAVSTAVLAAVLISFQDTEFGIKTAILSSLVATCALVPVFERLGARWSSRRTPAGDTEEQPRAHGARPSWSRLARAVRDPTLVAIAVLALAAPVDAALLGHDRSIPLIERGLTPHHVQ